MNAIDLIKQDHREVEQLFGRYEAGPSPDERREIVEQVIHDLSVHAGIEEMIFYPSVREALPQGDGLVDESLHEHQEAKELLARLDDMDGDDPALDTTMRELMNEIRHHVQEEETEILPALQQRLDTDLLEQMGREMEDAKSRAPTRPHPMAPNTPPANKVAGPGAAIVDRIRDTLQDRPEA